MKIAHIVRRFCFDEWGGTESVVWNIALQQKAQGLTPEILCTAALDQVGVDVKCGITIRRFQSTLSEQERLEAERQQRDAERDARIAELEKEKAIGDYTAKFLATGYSADLAKSSALAMAEGNNAQVFADMNAFIAERTKQLQAEALNNQPQLTNGSPVVTPTPEDDLTAAFRKAIGL